MDRSDETGLVLRRPSHPRRRLLALSEPDRGRAARGHDAADPRRVAQRRIGADLGSVLLLPKTILHRRRQPAVEERFFFQAEDGIRDYKVTGVQTCALPI